MGWEIVWILAGLLAVELLIHVISVPIILQKFEKTPPLLVAPSEPVPAAERVSIPTTHNLTLRGSLYTPSCAEPMGLVIFCPELYGNHWMAMLYCRHLVDSGFTVLAFDFRGQGESDTMPGYKPIHWLTNYEVRDVLSVVKYARTRDDLADLPIGLMGVSRGGGAALAAASFLPDVDCVVSDSAFSTVAMMTLYTRRWARDHTPVWFPLMPEWHLGISLWITRRIVEFRRRCHFTALERLLPKLSRRRVLLIRGERDTYIRPEISQHLQETIGGDCELWSVKKAKHNTARETAPEEYDRRIVDVFNSMVPVHRLAEMEPVAKADHEVERPVKQLAD